jgi:hypothetical protein
MDDDRQKAMMSALYLNVFVLIVQAFRKVPT